MRPKLLKNFLTVFCFWWIATTLWWSFSSPEVNLAALVAIKQLLPFLPIAPPSKLSILNAWQVQLDVFLYWSIPVIIVATLAGLIGAGLVFFYAWQTARARSERETGAGEFRGISQTVGVLPSPEQLPKDDIDLGADDNELLGKVNELERRLLCDVLGTISAHPGAYPGPGITVSLLEHTLNLTGKALTARRNPGLAAVVAAANELGNITAYKKDSAGDWVPAKPHGRESARILSMLDSWGALPLLERNAVLMAVKYYANPREMPEPDGDMNTYRLARDILTAASGAQSEAVIEQKQRTLEKSELPDLLFDAFLKALPQLSFQSRGLPKGVAAVAWKIGSRVYLLEIKLRETVMAKLPEQIRGALAASGAERQRLQPFTAELLKALKGNGWLVQEINGTRLDAKEALWNIKAGKLDFKGVIVIDVPAEFMSRLPADDSMYEISVMGPLFSSAGSSMNLKAEDLLGSVLRPGPNGVRKSEPGPE